MVCYAQKDFILTPKTGIHAQFYKAVFGQLGSRIHFPITPQKLKVRLSQLQLFAEQLEFTAQQTHKSYFFGLKHLENQHFSPFWHRVCSSGAQNCLCSRSCSWKLLLESLLPIRSHLTCTPPQEARCQITLHLEKIHPSLSEWEGIKWVRHSCSILKPLEIYQPNRPETQC